MNQHEEELKNRFYSLLQEQQLVYLGTVEELQPRVRPVTVIFAEKRFFVISIVGDGKIGQIEGNPRTEFSLLLKEENRYENLRVECRAELLSEPGARSMLYARIPWVKDYFSSPEDARFVLIELHPRWLYYKEQGRRRPTRVNLAGT